MKQDAQHTPATTRFAQREPARGTTPDGASSEEDAARWVQEMFGEVAPRYDFLNHTLSLNIDRGWRRRTVRRLMPILQKPDTRILDLCCGTGDLLVEMERAAGRPLLGSDFCYPMLAGAAAKLRHQQMSSSLFDGDGLGLPLRDHSLDLITIAFGFRNLVNYHRGLAELYRVLKPGGTLAILEFSHPPNRLIRAGYELYSHHVLPRLGGIISGSKRAYRYLPSSVRKFPTAPELAAWIKESGFRQADFEYFTSGVVALHLGQR